MYEVSITLVVTDLCEYILYKYMVKPSHPKPTSFFFDFMKDSNESLKIPDTLLWPDSLLPGCHIAVQRRGLGRRQLQLAIQPYMYMGVYMWTNGRKNTLI